MNFKFRTGNADPVRQMMRAEEFAATPNPEESFNQQKERCESGCQFGYNNKIYPLSRHFVRHQQHTPSGFGTWQPSSLLSSPSTSAGFNGTASRQRTPSGLTRSPVGEIGIDDTVPQTPPQDIGNSILCLYFFIRLIRPTCSIISRWGERTFHLSFSSTST